MKDKEINRKTEKDWEKRRKETMIKRVWRRWEKKNISKRRDISDKKYT